MPDNSPHGDQVEQWVKNYTSSIQTLTKAAEAIRNAIIARISDDGLNYHNVDSRVKSPDSLKEKLDKQINGKPKYIEGVHEITDQIGVRVITFITSDVNKVIQSLTGTFKVEEHVDKTDQAKQAGIFGYAGQHLVLTVPHERPPLGCGPCAGQVFEVQVRTILQHAWAEFEHDIRYKSSNSVPELVNRAFTMASGLIELADEQFDTIHQTVADKIVVDPLPDGNVAVVSLSMDVMINLSAKYLPQFSRSRNEHYAWLIDLMNSCNIKTEADAISFFEETSVKKVADRMSYRFEPGHVRVVDDLLLSSFKEQYIDWTSNIGDDDQRKGKLKYRLSRLASKK